MLTALLFTVVFSAFCLLAFVRHPIYGLLAYVGVFYLHPPSRWWGQGMLEDVRWSLVAAAVTLLALLVHRTSESTVAVTKLPAFRVFAAFVLWIAVQSAWALDPEAHSDLLEYSAKFILVIVMICKCIDSEKHLLWFLSAHVLGCFYLGWLAFWSFSGGRLDGVGGPGIDEANAAGLQMVTGIFVAAALLLVMNNFWRAALVGMLPFMLNGLVATVSRSGFLAVIFGGIAFNLFSPQYLRKWVRALSVLAVLLFAMLASQTYWDRIASIKYKGEAVEGVDTGGGRLEIMQAQWRMFQGRPFGCGHMCTTVLSPSYIEARYLSGGEARASHNTIMTMLVDHGIPGVIFYVAMVAWLFKSLLVLARRLKGKDCVASEVLPALAAIFAAITIGDLFVQYPKFEARFWFVSILIVLMNATKEDGNHWGQPNTQRDAA